MIDVRQSLRLPSGRTVTFYSLPMLGSRGGRRSARLPVSLRILLESVVRNLDGKRICDVDVEEALAGWQPSSARVAEVPLVVGRVPLQDFTGVPRLVDLASMRSAVARRGADIGRVQPLIPVELVIDHSVQVDDFGQDDALRLVGMGVLPCQLPDGGSSETLGLDGTERFDLELGRILRPGQTGTLHIERGTGDRESVPVVLRIDTRTEVEHFVSGGILPHRLDQLLREGAAS